MPPGAFNTPRQQERALSNSGGGGTTSLAQRLSGGERFGTILSKDSIARTVPLKGRFEALRGRHIDDVNDTTQETNRLDAGASSAIAQKFGRGGGFAGNLEQAVRKAKARGGIANRGDAAIKNQALKDRVSIARQNIARRGQNINVFGNASRQRQGLDTVMRQSKDQVNASVAGAVGSIAGGLSSAINNGLFSSDGIDAVSMDRGTASADFQIKTPNAFDFGDPFTNPEGSQGTVFS